jgi:hypothetical protein
VFWLLLLLLLLMLLLLLPAPVEVDSDRILPCRHGEHRRRSGEQPGVLGEDTHVQRCGHQDQPQRGQSISCICLCTGAAEEEAAREEADENLRSVMKI